MVKRNKFVVGGAAAFLLAWSVVSPACATTLARLTLTQLVRSADTIVRARCTSTESHWDGGAIWTITGFDVLETFKGVPPDRVMVRLPGGRVGHIVTSVEAVPRFQPGEEGFLFLEKTQAGDYSVTAWAEGTFRLQPATRGSGATVTQESSTFPVFDTGARRFCTEGVRRMPVAQFRERLAVALAAAPGGSAR